MLVKLFDLGKAQTDGESPKESPKNLVSDEEFWVFADRVIVQ